MEVLDSSRPERPAAGRGTRVTAAALAVVAVGQVAALAEDRSLPAGLELAALDGGYTVGTSGDPQAVVLQLERRGPVVDLEGVRAEVPGLRLVDVVAAGTATGGREVGAGPAGLPRLRLGEGVTLTLRFEVVDCDAVDGVRRPVVLQLSEGRRRGERPLALRDYPDLTGADGPDLRWQQVLALANCPSG